jgi:hypothetical protein
VDELARVADRLLLLAPEAEPPAGFESRVLAAARPAGGSTPARGLAGGWGRARRVGLVSALVVAAALGGGVVGSQLRSPDRPEPTALRTGLAVSPSGRVSCRVVVSGTRPASVLVSLDGYPGADSDVTVELQTISGVTVPLGPVHVTGGHGLLVSTLDLEARSLALMRMLDRDGKVIYEATLHDHDTISAP